MKKSGNVSMQFLSSQHSGNGPRNITQVKPVLNYYYSLIV